VWVAGNEGVGDSEFESISLDIEEWREGDDQKGVWKSASVIISTETYSQFPCGSARTFHLAFGDIGGGTCGDVYFDTIMVVSSSGDETADSLTIGAYNRPQRLAVDNTLGGLRNELSQLNTKIDHFKGHLTGEHGPDSVFLPLVDRCYELELKDYSYEFCPFKRIVQKNKDGGALTKLGEYRGWAREGAYSSWSGAVNEFTHQKYADGDPCHTGEERGVMVRLVCGTTNEVLSIEEPSTCTYELVFSTPGACE